MERIIERSLLFDFYGDLLTPHQQRIYSEAVFNDMSLSELSEEEGISRQGIHDLIKRCDKQLEGYEDKLKLIERSKKIRKDADQIGSIIDSCSGLDDDIASKIREKLKDIIDCL